MHDLILPETCIPNSQTHQIGSTSSKDYVPIIFIIQYNTFP